jgi:hypothetical protein
LQCDMNCKGSVSCTGTENRSSIPSRSKRCLSCSPHPDSLLSSGIRQPKRETEPALNYIRSSAEVGKRGSTEFDNTSSLCLVSVTDKFASSSNE